jgi:signal transduction histidine kinase
VTARLVTITIFVTIIYSLIIFSVPVEYQTNLFHIGLFILSLFLILFSVHIGAERVKRELKIVENYLSGIDSFNSSNPEAQFFTYEFEQINRKLIQILKKVKRNDSKKRKYTAKIKLKNRQRSDMLSAIAHEFRNPISSIMGYAQTINDDDNIPPALRKKFLTKIYNNGEKVEELLSRLLLWNRFESGEQKLQISKFNIQPLIQDIASNLEYRYKNRRVLVDKRSLTVKADRALIEIVIKNLIENGLKYSKDDVRVKIDKDRVSIIDRGVGISPENIDKVTKRFFRIEEHSWDNSMGLGLAIVKQILKLHNSSLRIKSQENNGSTFYFYI